MPGTSTSGVKRLRRWMVATIAGVVTVLVLPVPVWAMTARIPAFVTVRSSVERLPAIGAGSAPTPVVTGGQEAAVPTTGAAASEPIVTAGPDRAEAAVSGALPGAVPGQAAGVAGAAEAGLSGSATGVVADPTVESVTAPPAALPWIVGVLLVLVVAGAARAYQRSPQRAAVRRSRRPGHDVVG